VLDGGVWHEGDADVGLHHHDGRSRPGGGHLSFGGHFAASEAHYLFRFVVVFERER